MILRLTREREGERERDRERERERETDRQTERETDRQTDRQTETARWTIKRLSACQLSACWGEEQTDRCTD